MFKRFSLVAVALMLSTVVFAQTEEKKTGDTKAEEKKAEPNEESLTSNDKVEKFVLESLNKFRKENKADDLTMHEKLQLVSALQADYMAKSGSVTLDQKVGNLTTTVLRAQSLGCTDKVFELVIAVPAAKGKAAIDPKLMAEEVLKKWKTSKKEKPILNSAAYTFIGISARMDEGEKKMFVSLVFGSANSFNEGATKRKELPVPFTKKKFRLAPIDEKDKACKNCLKFKDWVALHEGLYVEKNRIYLKYESLKAIEKLLKEPKDGFAVDIIQREQYEPEKYNILDNTKVNKGVMRKRKYTRKVFKKNRVKDGNSLDIKLGKFPKKITGEYELNLLVIQDGKVCKTIMPSYLEEGDQKSSTPLELQVMPDSSAYFKPAYTPVAENNQLNFVIPFDKNKYDYKSEDMKPFLDALKEPEFIIENLDISAFSSIEGDSTENKKLQMKRAESIVKALGPLQRDKSKYKITTGDTWDEFKKEAGADPKYKALAAMDKVSAINEIKSKGLAEELEPILSKQRYAKMTLDVFYDISGKKEEKYVISQFNKAVKAGDIKQALKIQYYIEKCVLSKKYHAEAISQMEIPMEAKFSGLLMNKHVYKYQNTGKKLTEAGQKEMLELAKLDPSNHYITYNNLIYETKLDTLVSTEPKVLAEAQRKVDVMYTKSGGGYAAVPKKQVDQLNIEYQFKIIDAMDTTENAEAIIAGCIEKIKGFYNFKEASWQNALKLGYVFIKFKDYAFAANIMEPYMREEKSAVDEQFIFTFITACAQVPEKAKSKLFATALKRASELNAERYCKLFGEPFLSFQILENPFVKEDFLKFECKN